MRAFKTVVYAITTVLVFFIINLLGTYFFSLINTGYIATDTLLIIWFLLLYANAIFWSFFGLSHLLETSTCISYAVIPTVIINLWYLNLATFSGFLSTLLNIAITVTPLILRNRSLKKKYVQTVNAQPIVTQTQPVSYTQPILPAENQYQEYICPSCNQRFMNKGLPKFCPKCGYHVENPGN